MMKHMLCIISKVDCFSLYIPYLSFVMILAKSVIFTMKIKEIQKLYNFYNWQ